MMIQSFIPLLTIYIIHTAAQSQGPEIPTLACLNTLREQATLNLKPDCTDDTFDPMEEDDSIHLVTGRLVDDQTYDYDTQIQTDVDSLAVELADNDRQWKAWNMETRRSMCCLAPTRTDGATDDNGDLLAPDEGYIITIANIPPEFHDLIDSGVVTALLESEVVVTNRSALYSTYNESVPSILYVLRGANESIRDGTESMVWPFTENPRDSGTRHERLRHVQEGTAVFIHMGREMLSSNELTKTSRVNIPPGIRRISLAARVSTSHACINMLQLTLSATRPSGEVVDFLRSMAQFSFWARLVLVLPVWIALLPRLRKGVKRYIPAFPLPRWLNLHLPNVYVHSSHINTLALCMLFLTSTMAICLDAFQRPVPKYKEGLWMTMEPYTISVVVAVEAITRLPMHFAFWSHSNAVNSNAPGLRQPLGKKDSMSSRSGHATKGSAYRPHPILPHLFGLLLSITFLVRLPLQWLNAKHQNPSLEVAMHAVQILPFFIPESVAFVVFGKRLIEGIAGVKIQKKKKEEKTTKELRYVESLLKRSKNRPTTPDGSKSNRRPRDLASESHLSAFNPYFIVKHLCSPQSSLRSFTIPLPLMTVIFSTVLLGWLTIWQALSRFLEKKNVEACTAPDHLMQLNYMLVQFLSLNPISQLDTSDAELVRTLVDALLAGAIFSIVLVVVLLAYHVGGMIMAYDLDIAKLRRGNYMRLDSLPTFQHCNASYRHKSSYKGSFWNGAMYMGYQIGFGFFGVWFMASVLMMFMTRTLMLLWVPGIWTWISSVLQDLAPVLIALAFSLILDWIFRVTYVRNVYAPQTGFYMRDREVWSLLSYFQFPSTLVKSILGFFSRLIASGIALVAYGMRLDVANQLGILSYAGSSCNLYAGFLLADHHYNNPIMLCFIRLIRTPEKERLKRLTWWSKLRNKRKQIITKKDGTIPNILTSDNGTIECHEQTLVQHPSIPPPTAAPCPPRIFSNRDLTDRDSQTDSPKNPTFITPNVTGGAHTLCESPKHLPTTRTAPPTDHAFTHQNTEAISLDSKLSASPLAVPLLSDQHSANTAAESYFTFGSNVSDQQVATRAKKLARNRWALAYTLTRNPQLIVLRIRAPVIKVKDW